MLTKTFNLHFYPKKRSGYSGGKLPIYMRVTVDGQRFEMTTDRECEPEKWNSISARKAGNKEDSRLLNAHLDGLQAKVYAAQQGLINSGRTVTAEGIKNILLGNVEKPKMICDVFAQHNQDMKELVGKDFTIGTFNRYDAALRNIRLFFTYKYKVLDMPIENLDFKVISDYAFYLKAVRHISHNVAMRYLKYFKKIVLLCVKYGWIARDPFFAYKITFKELDRRPLTQDELDKIAAKDFKNHRLQKVRDIFLFCCYTGLAYIDVKNLRRSNITRGSDNTQWLTINRQKTGTPSRVPLLATPLRIMDFYRADPACEVQGYLLPVLSNQKMNSYLKEISDVCGLNRPVTFHLARHTFATTVTLANDVPMETVSKMLGHKDLKTTQHYAKIVDLKVRADMEKLGRKLE